MSTVTESWYSAQGALIVHAAFQLSVFSFLNFFLFFAFFFSCPRACMSHTLPPLLHELVRLRIWSAKPAFLIFQFNAPRAFMPSELLKSILGFEPVDKMTKAHFGGFIGLDVPRDHPKFVHVNLFSNVCAMRKFNNLFVSTNNNCHLLARDLSIF